MSVVTGYGVPLEQQLHELQLPAQWHHKEMLHDGYAAWRSDENIRRKFYEQEPNVPRMVRPTMGSPTAQEFAMNEFNPSGVPELLRAAHERHQKLAGEVTNARGGQLEYRLRSVEQRTINDMERLKALVAQLPPGATEGVSRPQIQEVPQEVPYTSAQLREVREKWEQQGIRPPHWSELEDGEVPAVPRSASAATMRSPSSLDRLSGLGGRRLDGRQAAPLVPPHTTEQELSALTAARIQEAQVHANRQGAAADLYWQERAMRESHRRMHQSAAVDQWRHAHANYYACME